MKRLGIPLIAALAIAGCAKQVPVPPQDIHPGLDLKKVEVTTLDGYVYSFDRVVFSADSLIGYSTVTEERIDNGQIAYVDVPQETRLSLAIIDGLQREKREVGQMALYGLGVAAVGFIFADVASSDEPTGHTSGGGKPPINGPDN